MVRIFDLLLRLYPLSHRVEFGEEMRMVFLTALEAARARSPFALGRLVWCEMAGLIGGAATEHWLQLVKQAAHLWPLTAAMVAGTVLAFAMHAVLYRILVPIPGHSLARLRQLFPSFLIALWLFAANATGQQQKQQPDVLNTAKSIYRASLVAIREAKTLDDMKKLADSFDSPDWISVDRFGRTVFTRRDADQALAAMLALPADRRITGLEIIWAERNADRLIVVGWMMPNEVERVDAVGEYGDKGITHRVMRGTLFRDIFANTPDGWRRIRHEKFLPNDMVLAVDGMPRIVPPLAGTNRVTLP